MNGHGITPNRQTLQPMCHSVGHAHRSMPGWKYFMSTTCAFAIYAFTLLFFVAFLVPQNSEPFVQIIVVGTCNIYSMEFQVCYMFF